MAAAFSNAAPGHRYHPVIPDCGGTPKKAWRNHTLLMANCLAQSQALMKGRTLAEATAQLLSMGKDKAEAKRLAPHRVFTGNRPSVTLAYKKLDPHTLGRLIALYEHRVFVEAAIWDINAFDQWGVELGKELALDCNPSWKARFQPRARQFHGRTCELPEKDRCLDVPDHKGIGLTIGDSQLSQTPAAL